MADGEAALQFRAYFAPSTMKIVAVEELLAPIQE
jgi:hypothetical protein